MLIDLKQSGAERGEWQNLWVLPTTYSLHYNLGAAACYSAALLPATYPIPLTTCGWLPHLSRLSGFLILVWGSLSLSNFIAPAKKPRFYIQAGSLLLHFSWSHPCLLHFRQKIPTPLCYTEAMSALANTVAQWEQMCAVKQCKLRTLCTPHKHFRGFLFEQVFMARTLIYIRTGPQFPL